MTDRLVTSRQLADQLAVSTETVLRWTRDGKLPAIRLPGGAIRYRESDLDAWIEERATTERGSASRPAGRRPAGNLALASRPTNEED